MAGFYAHVQILRDGELMLQRQLSGAVLLGSSASASLPLPGLESDLQLLSPTVGGFTLRLPPAVRGKLRAGGRILRVREGLLHDPRPEPLVFGDGDRGALWLDDGHLQLRFSIVQRGPMAWRPRIDPSLALALGSTAILLVGSALLITRYGARPRIEGASPLQLRPAIVEQLLKLQKQREAHRSSPARVPGSKARERSVRRSHKPRPPRRLSRRQKRRRISTRLHRALTATRGLLLPGGAVPSALAQLPTPKGRGPSESLSARLSSRLRGLDARALPKALAAPLPRPDHKRVLASKGSARAGMPSKKAIRDAVSRHKGEVRLCYERALLVHSAPPEGRLLLRWRIDGKGSASGIRTVRDGPASPSLTRCIIKRLRSWSFPPCQGATCEVIYPFEFFSQS